jgi:hypothetical protein
MKLKSAMKFSDKTLTILKNFSSINQSLLFSKGNVIRTMSVMKNILAEAVIDEELPREFGIYELNQFLNGLALHPDAKLDFENDSYLLIKDNNNNKTKYYYSNPSVIVSPPDKNMELPSQDICFQLDSSKLNQLLKAAGVYQVPDLCAVGDGATIKLVVRDKENSTSNEYSIEVGETDKVFVMNYKVENIKIIAGKYDVIISKRGISKFINNNLNLVYYIALEPDSTFEE